MQIKLRCLKVFTQAQYFISPNSVVNVHVNVWGMFNSKVEPEAMSNLAVYLPEEVRRTYSGCSPPPPLPLVCQRGQSCLR